jgi:hypothetical protein
MVIWFRAEVEIGGGGQGRKSWSHPRLSPVFDNNQRKIIIRSNMPPSEELSYCG